MIGTMKKISLVVALAALLGSTGYTAFAAGSGSSKASPSSSGISKTGHLYGNHKCPATGEKVDPKSYFEYKDEEHGVYGRIYQCCDGCSKKISKDPKKIYEKLYRTDPKTGKLIDPKDLKNEECPVSGDEVDPKSKIEYNGMIVHFCCNDCIKTFLKNPEKYMAKLLPDAKEFEFKAGGGSGTAK